MFFLTCGNEFIYVVSVGVRTKGASSAHVPSTEQLQSVTVAAGVLTMCPWALSCRRQSQPGFGVIKLSLSIEVQIFT